MKNTRRIISMVLTVIMMLLPLSSLGATGHIDGCTNTDFSTNCCTKTFIIIPKTGYRVLDVIVNGVSKGAITSYTFTNITGPQNLKVITEPIGGTIPGGGTGGDTGGGTETGIKVKFNPNGGLGSMPSQTFEEGTAQYLNPCAYTKDGFEFVGWSTTASGAVEYEDECSFSTTETLTLYAVWMPGISSVTAGTYIYYEPTVAEYSGFYPNQTKIWRILSNNSGQLDIIAPQSVGDLKIEAKSGDSSGISTLNTICSKYADTTYASSARSIKRSDVSKITANGNMLVQSSEVWLADQYSTDTQGGIYSLNSSGTVNSNYMQSYGGSIGYIQGFTYGVRPLISLKTGLWITEGKGTESEPYTIGIKPVKTYRVTFDSNGGMGTMSTQTFTEGETKNLTTNTFTNLGKNFLGWATSSTGSVQLTDGQSYTATGHITLYAVWANQYTIKFNKNGGSGTMADQIFSEGVAQALIANTFTRTGYTFSGWSTTSAGAAEYTDKDSYTATGDKTLYAVWEQDMIVSIDSIDSYLTVKYGSKSLSAGQNYVVKSDSIKVSAIGAKGYIYLNNSLIASNESGTATFDYSVTSNVSITHSTSRYYDGEWGPFYKVYVYITTN